MFRTFLVAAVAALVTLLSINASFARDWELLGERHVGFINDHDTIHIGRHDGRFKRLKVIVKNNDIELNSIKVTFGNNEVEEYVYNHHIHPGMDGPTIDLRGGWHEGRFIRDVEFHYHSRPDFRGEAIAELWGQED